MDETSNIAGQRAVSVSRAADSTLLIRLSEPWHLTRDVASASVLNRELESARALKTISFDTSSLTHWDSGLIAFLVQTSAACRARNIEQDRAGLPDGLRRLRELAEAVFELQRHQAPVSTTNSFRSNDHSVGS